MRRRSTLRPGMGTPGEARGHSDFPSPYRRRHGFAGFGPRRRFATTGTHGGGSKFFSVFERAPETAWPGGGDLIETVSDFADKRCRRRKRLAANRSQPFRLRPQCRLSVSATVASAATMEAASAAEITASAAHGASAME